MSGAVFLPPPLLPAPYMLGVDRENFTFAGVIQITFQLVYDKS
jgi:hypothetical protein